MSQRINQPIFWGNGGLQRPIQVINERLCGRQGLRSSTEGSKDIHDHALPGKQQTETDAQTCNIAFKKQVLPRLRSPLGLWRLIDHPNQVVGGFQCMRSGERDAPSSEVSKFKTPFVTYNSCLRAMISRP